MASSLCVAGVSFKDKVAARAIEAKVFATAASPTRVVDTTRNDSSPTLITSRIHPVQNVKENTAALAAPRASVTSSLNPMATIFVPTVAAAAPAVVVQEEVQEEGEEEYEGYGEEGDSYGEKGDEYDEDEELNLHADLAHLELTERPPRYMLFNVKCRYYRKEGGCTMPFCCFLHDEEPVFHDSVSIATSAESPTPLCRPCDSPVNGMFYFMSIPTTTLDQPLEPVHTPPEEDTPEDTPEEDTLPDEKFENFVPLRDIARIYVGNMPSGCNKSYLKAVLASVDIAVINIGVNRSKLSCKHRSAFVQVEAADAERALETLDGHDFGGSEASHLSKWASLGTRLYATIQDQQWKPSQELSPNDIMHAGW